MSQGSPWEMILTGIFVVILLIFLVPRIKHSFAQSRAATSDDWKSLLIPIGAVILFVILLIAIV